MSAHDPSRAAATKALAARLRRAFESALGDLSPRALVAAALPPLPPKRAIVRVIAIGKAAVPMMLGALDRWPDRIDRALVITVDGPVPHELATARLAPSIAASSAPDSASIAPSSAPVATSIEGPTPRLASSIAASSAPDGASIAASSAPVATSIEGPTPRLASSIAASSAPDSASIATSSAPVATSIAASSGGAPSAAEVAGAGSVEVVFAAHPVPDVRSVAAAERALAMVRGLDLPDLVVVLMSGGASALAALPADGLSLDDKRALVSELLASGANIRDVNLVRRHASRFKGGRLAEAAAPARVLTLAISDVIGGGLHDIGSGPSVPDPTTVAQAEDVLRRFAPTWEGHLPLAESLKPSGAPRFRARVIAGPDTFADRLVAALHAEGLERVHVLPAEEGDADDVAARRLTQARALAPGDALVISCEPTVRLPLHPGRGGRAGRIALHVLADLPDDVALLCGATDGADGPSRTAGAVVTAADLPPDAAPLLARALAAFDDAPFHESLGTHLPAHPTGLNFTDVHILARLP